uniref:Nucleoside diphosphate kinase B n=1 Tax=Fundulus heteroclitus TaxID=8078 RepID=A0A3Q2U0R6_FUNHE
MLRQLCLTELTFIAIKPDGVQRGIIGEIIKRFEMKGFKLVGMKMLEASEDLLMESGPVVTGRVTQLMKSKKCIFVFVSLIQRHEGLNVSVLQRSQETEREEKGTLNFHTYTHINFNIENGSNLQRSAATGTIQFLSNSTHLCVLGCGNTIVNL